MKRNDQTVEAINKLLQHATPTEFATLKRSLLADTRKGVKEALARTERRIAAEERETMRLEALYDFDKALCHSCVLGLDEVGRGPLAGPLAVGGVVLDLESRIAGLNDSKQIPEDKRAQIAEEIKQTARAWTVQYVAPEEIDAQGMSACLRKAFSAAIKAIEEQGIAFDAILLDGNPLRLDEREHNVVKGDSKSASIAAASIIAKVDRDARMRALALEYPAYAFDQNKGYASESHIAAIKSQGLCPIHRKSFCSGFLQDSLF